MSAINFQTVETLFKKGEGKNLQTDEIVPIFPVSSLDRLRVMHALMRKMCMALLHDACCLQGDVSTLLDKPLTHKPQCVVIFKTEKLMVSGHTSSPCSDDVKKLPFDLVEAMFPTRYP